MNGRMVNGTRCLFTFGLHMVIYKYVLFERGGLDSCIFERGTLLFWYLIAINLYTDWHAQRTLHSHEAVRPSIGGNNKLSSQPIQAFRSNCARRRSAPTPDAGRRRLCRGCGYVYNHSVRVVSGVGKRSGCVRCAGCDWQVNPSA
jgi:RNase P subunit RPR2